MQKITISIDEIKSVLLAEFQNKGLISEFKLENNEKHHKQNYKN